MRWGFLGLVSLSAWAAPLFPEDGSKLFSKWVTSSEGLQTFENPKLFEDFLKAMGVEVVRVPVSYEWIQDLSFSFEDGSVALQALVPGIHEGPEPSHSDRYRGWWGFNEPDFLQDMTIGVLSEEEGWLRIHPKHWQDLGWTSRRLHSSVVEGGDLVSGVDAFGKSYALVDLATVLRTQALLQLPSTFEAQKALAADLGLDADRLIVLELGGHLDTQIKTLPGGVVLIQSPEEIVPTLEKLSRRASPGSQEKRAYEVSARLHRDGLQRFDFRGNPIGPPLKPWSSSSEDQLRKARERLQMHLALRVVPMMGQFASVADEKTAWSMSWRNNLFNAITGQHSSGRTFFVGNRTVMAEDPKQRLVELEEYWKERLVQLGLDADLVHFFGRFDGAGGANCSGFPKP